MMKNLLDTIAKNLKLGRKRLNITQAKLAELAKVSTTFLAEIESSKKLPSMETLLKLATGLDLEPYELLIPESAISKLAPQMAKEKLVEVVSDSLNQYINTTQKSP